MSGRHSQHLDLHLHVLNGRARLEGTGKVSAPENPVDLGDLSARAAGIDAQVSAVLVNGSSNLRRSLLEAADIVDLGFQLGRALGDVGRELAVYAHLPYVRLWVHAEDDAAGLPWEALALPLYRDGRSSFSRVGELRGWQVLRARAPGAPRPARSTGALGRVVLVVGDLHSRDHSQGEEREFWTPAFETVDAILEQVPPSVQLDLFVCRASFELDPERWSDLGARSFTGSHDLQLAQSSSGVLAGPGSRASSDAAEPPTLMVVLGHTCEDPLPDHSTALHAGATSLLLDSETPSEDPQSRSLPIVAHAAHGRRTLAELLPGDVRLLLFLGCRTGERFAAEFPAVDHVIGLRTYVPPELTTIVARQVLGALCRPGSATVGEAARLARRALGLLAADVDPSGALAPLWWTPAHWPAVADDEPFLDPQTLLLSEYREGLRAHVQGLEGDMSHHRRGLAQVAIPLHVGAKGNDLGDGAGPDHRLRKPATPTSTLLDLVTEPRGPGSAALRARPGTWVLHGPPGSGKSTSARDVARQLSEGSLGLIPVYVSLAEWRKASGAVTLEGLVVHLVERVALAGRRPGQADEVLVDLQRALLDREDRLVLLLDGLDEVGELRARAEDLLRNLRRLLPKAAVLVTTRPSDYRPIESYEDAWLQPLSADQMQELLYRWYSGELAPDDAEERARRDLLTIEAKDHALRELAQIPLFLNLMAQLLLKTGKLEESRRHEFLKNMVSWILAGKHRPLATPFGHPAHNDPQAARRILRAIARELSRRATTLIGYEELHTWLEHEAPAPLRGAQPFGVAAFLAAARENGLLRPASSDPREREGEWRFWHRAFQEILTAEDLYEEFLAGGSDLQLLTRFAQAIATAVGTDAPEGASSPLEHWREPFALLAGYLGKRGSDWIEALLSGEATRPIGLASVATAEGLSPTVVRKALASCTEWRESQLVYEPLGARLGRGPEVIAILEERGLALAKRMRGDKFDLGVRIELHFLIECLDVVEIRPQGEKAAEARGKILDAIAKPDPKVLEALFSRVPGKDEPLFVDVPGGSFRMGSPPGEERRNVDEDQVTVRLRDPAVERENAPCFRIARTTVTVEQYRPFDRAKPSQWKGKKHLPITEVTWYEASLFCRWLDHHGGLLKRDRATWSFQLPSEAQWEYACRDAPGMPEPRLPGYPRFVSGDSEAKLYAVAQFTRPASEGVRPVATKRAGGELRLYDMHGNVWEWCQDWFAQHLRDATNPTGPPAGAMRIQRGGSYWCEAAMCRAASRFSERPARDYNLGDHGFRVVLAPRPPRR